jgi:hypothetical protein
MGNQAELEIRGFFEGSLETVAGHRSSLGGMLDRLKYGLPQITASDNECDMGEVMIELAQHGRVRRALLRLPAPYIAALRVCYSPIPLGLVWGLITACGGVTGRGREVAALVVSRAAVTAPGASQWLTVDQLRQAASRRKKTAEKSAAADELASMVRDARRDLRAAEEAFDRAWHDVAREDSGHRHERFRRTVERVFRRE